MPSWAWHCVVEIGAVSVLVRTGWPIAGTGRAEAGCAAGAAAVTAGVASDSAAIPPTAATGRTVRAVTRMNADRPRDAARPGDDAALRADFWENTIIRLL